MECLLFPTLQARRFAFEDARCLYRDHLGRRVVADCEGPGRLFVERGTLEGLTGLEGDSFVDGFTAVSEGSAEATLLCGPCTDLPAPDAPRIEVEGEWTGGGWVVEADGPFELDDRHETAPAPLPSMPIPFWRAYRGARARLVERPWRAVLADSFSIADPEARHARAFRVQNMSDVLELDSTFEDGAAHRAPVASHLNTASWDVRAPSGAWALVLRKTYDRFHGRQRARVSADGAAAGYWYEPVESRVHRWAVADFAMPLPRGAERAVRLAIDPVAGSPLWSVSQIEVWALVPRG